MVQLIGSLVSISFSIAFFFAIIYVFVKAALAPVHEKLDRILALQQQALQSRVDAGSS